MGKHEPSDSEIESEELSGSGEEEEEPINSGRNVAKQGLSEYEKQRLSRIAENKVRMEALGLHKMVSSLMSSAQKSNQLRKTNQRKGKSKVVDDDDDDGNYRPSDDDDGDDFEEDEDFVDSKSSSKSRRNKVKNKSSKPKKKNIFQKDSNSGDQIDEVDDELMQAIALSLQDSAKDTSLKQRKGNANLQEDAGRKRKKWFNNRVQMTEDELVLNFFQFDATGNGFLTVRDLRRVAIAHDFTWTDMELADMICCFDSDGDAKLNLDDFRKIVSRCNMIRSSEN